MKKELIKDKDSRLHYFCELKNSALANMTEDFDLMQSQYLGDNSLDNVNGNNARKASVVRNITYELIESQVNEFIPLPNVVAKSSATQKEINAKNITNMLKNIRDELPFEKINDEDERNTYIYGSSVYLVDWNYEKQNVNITLMSPKQLIVEPNVMDIQDMQYFFLTYQDSKENIREKYGVEVQSDTIMDEEIEVNICFFKRDKTVCQYVFTAFQEIAYFDDYYAPRQRICKHCGLDESLCSCGSTDFEVKKVEEVKLKENYVSSHVTIPKMSPVIKDGVLLQEMVYDEKNKECIKVPKLKPTILPIYKPTLYPVCIRKNISKSLNFFGQSDVLAIRSQQQEINKLESRIMEKLLKAGVLPYSSESTDLRLSDEIYTRGIKLKNVNERSLLGVLDLQVSIGQDVEQANRLYEQAKRILGVSDAYQGIGNNSATSGVARQLLINQSSGRLQSKRVMKNAVYAELDRIIFEFCLAFVRVPKPVQSMTAYGESQTDVFNPYDFLEMREDGNFYYNDDYLFSTDITSDMERNKATMWTEIRNNYSIGAFGEPNSITAKLIYWKNMERARYPYAKDNLTLIKEAEIEMAKANKSMAVESREASGGHTSKNDKRSDK